MVTAAAQVPTGPLRALMRYSQQTTPTQFDVDRVMRALTEHDDFYVPVPVADLFWPSTNGPRLEMFAEAAPTRVLTVFTDAESATLATNYPIGAYVGGISGEHLLAVLDERYTDFVVN